MSFSAETEKYRLSSKAWKFFHIKDKELKLAICKLCKNVFSYRATVTNLLRHIQKRHDPSILNQDSSDESEMGEKPNFSSENEDDEDTNDNVSEENKNVKALQSLKNKPDEESVCLLCQMTFPDQNSDEMMKHMVEVHNISEIKLVDGNIHLQEEEEEESRPVKKTKRSVSWDYVTVLDDQAKIAVCNLCDRKLSYKSSVSNLIKHVKRKHHILVSQPQEESVISNKTVVNNVENKTPGRKQSMIWSFFKYINDEKTKCACIRCQKEFVAGHGIKHMKKHLLEKHPEALLHHKTAEDPLFISMTKEDTKEEESEEEMVEAEYLNYDDSDRQVTNKPLTNFERSGFERRPSFNQRPSVERRSKIPAHRSPTRSQTELPESLEYFTNYVTSLLLELPQKISKKLQMNFVKQIIEAQIAHSEEMDRNAEAAKKINSTVLTNDSSERMLHSIILNEEPASSTNADLNNGAIQIANGIIIQPIVTSS